MTAERAVERTPGTPRAMARRDFRFVVLNWFRELTLVPVIVVMMIAGAVVNPVFFTPSNLINVAEGGAALGMVVVAESLILLTGKFDISLQGTFGLAPLLGAWLIAPKASQGLGTEWNPWLGLLVVLLVGLAVGTFNGFLVIKANFNAFIFTLAMSILLTGLQLGWLGGQTVYNLPEAYIYLGAESWFGVPVAIWLTIAAFAAAALFLRYHRIGRAMYAIGGNLEAARAAGIQVDRIRIGVFIVASLLAAIGAADAESLSHYVAVGELGLDGRIATSPGVRRIPAPMMLPMVTANPKPTPRTVRS